VDGTGARWSQVSTRGLTNEFRGEDIRSPSATGTRVARGDGQLRGPARLQPSGADGPRRREIKLRCVIASRAGGSWPPRSRRNSPGTGRRLPASAHGRLVQSKSSEGTADGPNAPRRPWPTGARRGTYPTPRADRPSRKPRYRHHAAGGHGRMRPLERSEVGQAAVRRGQGDDGGAFVARSRCKQRTFGRSGTATARVDAERTDTTC